MLKVEDFITYKNYVTGKKENGFILEIEKDEDDELIFTVQNFTSNLDIVKVSEYDNYERTKYIKSSVINKDTYDVFVDLALLTKDNEWLKELSNLSKVRRKVIE